MFSLIFLFQVISVAIAMFPQISKFLHVPKRQSVREMKWKWKVKLDICVFLSHLPQNNSFVLHRFTKRQKYHLHVYKQVNCKYKIIIFNELLRIFRRKRTQKFKFDWEKGKNVVTCKVFWPCYAIIYQYL